MVTSLLCNWMSQVRDVIFHIIGEKKIVLRGQKVMQCYVSLENNKNYIKGQNASEAKLLYLTSTKA